MRRLPHQFEKVSLPYGFREFVGGMDPFGFWTTQQAAEREQRGQSHGIGRAAALAGGLVGGGVLVPSAISGVSAVFDRQPFETGAVRPWARLHRGYQLQDALGRSDWKRVREVLARRVPGDGPPSLSGLGEFARNVHWGDVVREGPGKAGQRAVRRLMRPSLSGIGLGAAIGGGGALLQYNKGVDMERDVQRRIRTAVAGPEDRFQMALNPRWKESSVSLAPGAGAGRRRSMSTRNFSVVGSLGGTPLERLRQWLTTHPKPLTLGQRGIGIRPR